MKTLILNKVNEITVDAVDLNNEFVCAIQDRILYFLVNNSSNEKFYWIDDCFMIIHDKLYFDSFREAIEYFKNHQFGNILVFDDRKEFVEYMKTHLN